MDYYPTTGRGFVLCLSRKSDIRGSPTSLRCQSASDPTTMNQGKVISLVCSVKYLDGGLGCLVHL